MSEEDYNEEQMIRYKAFREAELANYVSECINECGARICFGIDETPEIVLGPIISKGGKAVYGCFSFHDGNNFSYYVEVDGKSYSSGKATELPKDFLDHLKSYLESIEG